MLAPQRLLQSSRIADDEDPRKREKYGDRGRDGLEKKDWVHVLCRIMKTTANIAHLNIFAGNDGFANALFRDKLPLSRVVLIYR